MLSVEEFVTELLVGLEELVEGGFTETEEKTLRLTLEGAVRRLEVDDTNLPKRPD